MTSKQELWGRYAVSFGSIRSHKTKSKGVIYIEDITDKPFWEEIAVNHFIQLYSDGDRNFTGKSKILNICSQNNIIAIDSDFDFICPSHRDECILFWNNQDYILQTYAYSRENLIYSSEYLADFLDNKFKVYLDNHPNQIVDIMNGLSTVLYEPYLKYLFLKNEKVSLPFKWEEEIGFVVDSGSNDEGMLKQIINLNFVNYKLKIDSLANQLTPLITDPAKFSVFCSELTQKGLNKDSILYFIRGHNLEDEIVIPLIKQIKSQRMEAEKAYIDANFSANELGEKKGNLQNEFPQVKERLKTYFMDSYIHIAKQKNIFIKKIISDYEKMNLAS